MRKAADYRAKLERMAAGTLLPRLPPTLRRCVRRLALDYRLTFQELRATAQAARDLEMWREQSLPDWWEAAERRVTGEGRARKKALLRLLDAHLRTLASAEKVYPAAGLRPPPRRRARLAPHPSHGKIFGRCPVYSERTVCCGLYTLDAVRGCPFSCSYCTIQTFFPDTAEWEGDLGRRLEELDLDPRRRYHIGTGQASDSLVWGNPGGGLERLLEFAASHPNVLLELKTKSDRVGELLHREIPGNVVCSWSLNTPAVVRNEEHGTASTERRLRAARAVADRGIRVAFHFHPMVYYRSWSRDYPQLGEQLRRRFDPVEVSFVSLGAVTFIRPVVQEIRRRGGETKILQMRMVKDLHGKLTYPDATKERMYRRLLRSLEPWRDRVYFYLCMETEAVWRRVLGRSPRSNEAFEDEILDRCLPATADAVAAADGQFRRPARPGALPAGW